LLEPDARKRASPVLKGARRRKAPGLPDGSERQRQPALTIALTIQATSAGRSPATGCAAPPSGLGCALVVRGQLRPRAGRGLSDEAAQGAIRSPFVAEIIGAGRS